jgi:hypothetical protein
MSLRAPAASQISGRIAHDRPYHGRCSDFELLTEITGSFVIDHSSDVTRWSLRRGNREFFGASAEIAARKNTPTQRERAQKHRNIGLYGMIIIANQN